MGSISLKYKIHSNSILHLCVHSLRFPRYFSYISVCVRTTETFITLELRFCSSGIRGQVTGLSGSDFSRIRLDPWRWGRCVGPKRRDPSTEWRSVIAQKKEILKYQSVFVKNTSPRRTKNTLVIKIYYFLVLIRICIYRHSQEVIFFQRA